MEESKRKKLLALEDREGDEPKSKEKDTEEEPDPNQRERLVLMQPPRILFRMGLVQELKMWMIERTLYGLRESPKLWGDHRNAQSAGMEFTMIGRKLSFRRTYGYFKQMESLAKSEA